MKVFVGLIAAATLSTDDDTTHVVCCDPDVAMCGAYVPGDDWRGDDEPVDCYLCAVAEENSLPCQRPDCPDREVSR